MTIRYCNGKFSRATSHMNFTLFSHLPPCRGAMLSPWEGTRWVEDHPWRREEDGQGRPVLHWWEDGGLGKRFANSFWNTKTKNISTECVKCRNLCFVAFGCLYVMYTVCWNYWLGWSTSWCKQITWIANNLSDQQSFPVLTSNWPGHLLRASK